MIHAYAGFRENNIVRMAYCVGFIPVQFSWLASSSYPLGHTQTNVPVELSQVYPQLKPAAAQMSVTERKTRPSVETLFCTGNVFFNSPLSLVLFFYFAFFFFFFFIGFFRVKEDWDFFVTAQILKQQDFKRLNQQILIYFKVKLPGASHVLLSFLRLCPTKHEQLNDPGEFVQMKSRRCIH